MWSASESSVVGRSVRLGLRQEQLRRSGAIQSSRSAMSRQDGAYDDDEIIGVGQGKRATFIEHVLARLEQHGLRRCTCNEDEALPRPIAPVGGLEDADAIAHTRAADDASDVGHCSPDTERAPYYYLCVPCELRLTAVTTRAATRTMLQDVHDHFASAAHRRLARWMADPDINVTLEDSPLIAQPTSYVRVYVNGVPVLLSRRPGGGDMFYPLPHEEVQVSTHHGRHAARQQQQRKDDKRRRDAVMHDDASASSSPATHTTRLFPSAVQMTAGRDAVDGALGVYWYHPLRSLFTHSRQHVSLQPLPTAVRHGAAKSCRSELRSLRAMAVRRALSVQHVPLATYLDETLLHKGKVPVWPVLLPLHKRRRCKACSEQEENDMLCDDKHARRDGQHHTSEARGNAEECRMVYEQSLRDVIAVHPAAALDDTNKVWSDVDRCVVEAEAAYRVVLVSSEQQAQLASLSQQPQRPQALHEAATPVTLTRALLSQVITERPHLGYDEVSDTASSFSASSRASGTQSAHTQHSTSTNS